ncbi:MAG: tetratricopeptide repeat protein [Porcipelethomonas sp.]
MKNNNDSPRDKAKFYYTCHPDDVQLYFNEITKTILKYADCAIFYDDNPDSSDNDEDFFFIISEMRLIVIPITANFLYKECTARKVFYFAMEKHIPVLPILEDSSLESEFNRICGDLQFLDPNKRDATAISFDIKLQNYLDTIILGEETIELIRKEFSSYIFLSYRKKDRKAAQELMNTIHENDFCRDVAIWYDEFLTPGENFNESIEAALKKSDLFALTVTPNIVNENNYIMSIEYPMAIKENKEILPVEMIKTDINKLNEKYDSLPEVIPVENSEKLCESFRKSVKITEISFDPVHLYLIGLAYMNGIDVEINHEKGAGLIENAAAEGLEAAVSNMVQLYIDGYGVKRDYDKAIEWQEKLIEIKQEIFNESQNSDDELALAHEYDTLSSFYYTFIIDYDKALEYLKKALIIKEKILGTDDPATAGTYNDIGMVYSYMGEYSNALEMYEKVLEIRENILGTDHIDTASILNNIGTVYSDIGEYDNAIEMYTKALEIQEKAFGTYYPDTANSYNNIGNAYSDMGEYNDALEMHEKALEIREEIFGVNHSDTAMSYNNIGLVYLNLGEYDQALEMHEKALEIQEEIFGVNHPVTANSYNDIGLVYLSCGKYDRALEMYEKALNIQKKFQEKSILTQQDFIIILALYIILAENTIRHLKYMKRH